MTFPILETDRLQLIEILPEHATAIYEIFSNEEVVKYYGMQPFQQKEQALKMVESFSKGFLEKRSIRWGLVLKDSSEFIGTIGFNNLQLWSKKAEIGYDIHPNYWRKGYATEAVSAILEYGFGKINLNRIAAITYLENTSSFALLTKLGFKREGILRGYIFDGELSHDAYVYSKLLSD